MQLVADNDSALCDQPGNGIGFVSQFVRNHSRRIGGSDKPDIGTLCQTAEHQLTASNMKIRCHDRVARVAAPARKIDDEQRILDRIRAEQVRRPGGVMARISGCKFGVDKFAVWRGRRIESPEAAGSEDEHIRSAALDSYGLGDPRQGNWRQAAINAVRCAKDEQQVIHAGYLPTDAIGVSIRNQTGSAADGPSRRGSF